MQLALSLSGGTRPPPTRNWPRECLLSSRPERGLAEALSFLSRSIFKPFIFVDDVKLVPKAQSPCFGDDDPAKKEPRFQEKPDRRHELYKAHEWARAVLESDEVSLAGGPGSRWGHQEGDWKADNKLIILLLSS